jgi:DNA-binding winged helix-turn-helix (wHTH) protein
VRAAKQHLFASFRLDPIDEQLWCGEEAIPLRRKTFEVLRYLVEYRAQLVTKTALLDVLWPQVIVSDSMPTICVGELRKALGDDAKTPQFIETVHGRGYRFIAKVTTAADLTLKPRSRLCEPARIAVGRKAELALLGGWYSQVLEGDRRVVFVAGEPGIGKTTCVRAFLDSIGEEGAVRIGRGQCIEQYGAAEPYMPVLEALTRLLQEPGSEHLLKVLHRLAPTWLAQMPSCLARRSGSRRSATCKE